VFIVKFAVTVAVVVYVATSLVLANKDEYKKSNSNVISACQFVVIKMNIRWIAERSTF